LLLSESPKELISFSFEGNVMKRVLPVLLTLVCLFLFTNPIFAQTPEADSVDTEAEDDAAVARVIRVSFVEGDVSFQRAGTTEWAAVIENLPLFAGDQIYAGKEARVELQIGRGSYIRLSENTALTVADLRDDAVQFEIPAGAAFIRVEQLAKAFQRFEVDTPNAALLLQQDGLYRINVRGDNDSEVIVRRGAAEVSTDDGSFKVREGRRLLIDTSANGRLEVAYDTTQDDWDIWSTTRDATINSQYINDSPDYVTQYETTYSDFYGVSDLTSYGSWYSDPTYGNCWRPRGVGSGWAPYRQGQWIWTRAGWTWVSSEPWGWAPYHYGRWVYTPSFGWVWAPGYGRSTPRYNNYQWRAYYRWRPALVGFFDAPSPRGHYVGWYPLAPGQRWHRPDGQRLGGDHSRLQYPTGRDNWRGPGRSTFTIPPHEGRGVTLLPLEGFNRSDRTKLRPVTPDQDLSNWIRRGAKPGLPELKPAPVAIAPVPRDERRYHIAIPSNEIIHRPVVTRNRPTDSEATSNPPRERRLITPRAPVMSSDEPTRGTKRQRGDEQRVNPPAVTRPVEGENSNPSYQKPSRQRGDATTPRIMPADRAEGDNSRSERKAKRGGDESAQPVDSRSGNDSSSERHKRPAYTPPQQDPAAGSNDAAVRERKQRDEEQVRQRDEERAHQREEERQRRAEEERSRQRDEEVSRQRNEERARQREEERQRQAEQERARQRDADQQRQREAERQQRQNEERARQQQEERQRQQEADRARQQQEERQRHNDEERNRQRNEERVRDQQPREKPPAQQQEQRPSKEERRAEREQRKKS
jgi:hypothetical protein